MVTVNVVSHDDAPDRLVAIWAEAERLGFALRRQGVDPAEGDGRAALLAAHVACWRSFLESRAGYVAVLHDDALPEDPLAPLLDETVLDQLMAGEGLLCLSSTDEGHDPFEEPRVYRLAAIPGAMGAYVVSRAFASKLVEVADRGAADLRSAIERAVERRGELRCVVPAVVSCEEAASTDPGAGGLMDRTRSAVRRVARKLTDRSDGMVIPQPSAPRSVRSKEAISA